MRRTTNGKGWHFESQRHDLARQGVKTAVKDNPEARCMLKAGNISDNKFNSTQLKKGTIIEKEHTDDKSIAEQIAKAHLKEDKDYYKKLSIMGNDNKKC